MAQGNSKVWEFATLPAEGSAPALQLRFDGDTVQVFETRALPKPEGDSIEEYVALLQSASEGLKNTTTDFYLDMGWMYGSPSAEAGMTVSGWRELNEEESARYYA